MSSLTRCLGNRIRHRSSDKSVVQRSLCMLSVKSGLERTLSVLSVESVVKSVVNSDLLDLLLKDCLTVVRVKAGSQVM